MRFPRAVMIRDDLSVADCMTASGTSDLCLLPEVKLTNPLAVLEMSRNQKKRKMSTDGDG